MSCYVAHWAMPSPVEQTARTFSLQLDGIFYDLPAWGDEPITQDIESLCAMVATSALATRPSTP
jgi:hypothetical protein